MDLPQRGEARSGPRGQEQSSGSASDPQGSVKYRKIDEQLVGTEPASSTSSQPQLDREFLGGGDSGSAATNAVFQRAGHLESDMEVSSLDACNRFAGRETRYLRIMLNLFHQCGDVDVKMSELHEMVEDMAALSALETNGVKEERMGTNVTGVDMPDDHNQDLSRAPKILRRNQDFSSISVAVVLMAKFGAFRLHNDQIFLEDDGGARTSTDHWKFKDGWSGKGSEVLPQADPSWMVFLARTSSPCILEKRNVCESWLQGRGCSTFRYQCADSRYRCLAMGPSICESGLGS